MGLRGQVVAQFDREPVTGVVFSDWGAITDDRVHAFHVVTKTEVVAAIPEGV